MPHNRGVIVSGYSCRIKRASYSDALDGWLSMGPFSFAGATSPPFSVWLVDLNPADAAHHIGLRFRPARPQAQQGKDIVQVYQGLIPGPDNRNRAFLHELPDVVLSDFRSRIGCLDLGPRFSRRSSCGGYLPGPRCPWPSVHLPSVVLFWTWSRVILGEQVGGRNLQFLGQLQHRRQCRTGSPLPGRNQAATQAAASDYVGHAGAAVHRTAPGAG